MARFIAVLYSLACYVAFLLTTVYAVGFVSRVAVPNTIDTGTIAPTVEASAFNLLPIGVFAIQHSVMARKQFKQWWTHFVPTAVERSTCIVLKLGTRLPVLAMASNAGPGMADRRSPDRHGGNGPVGFWLDDRADQHLHDQSFRVFGLHQVANNLTGREAPVQRFRAPVFYKLVRHPVYLGIIIAFWVAPAMTIGHLLFAIATTAYICVGVGIFLEERDLVDLFGEDYRAHKDRVSMLAPLAQTDLRETRSMMIPLVHRSGGTKATNTFSVV
jgi:methanethiol S-methyltransferase